MSEASQNIINTLAFFDLFNYPLTAWELWRLSPVKTDLAQIMASLKTLPPAIAESQGFYFLAGRDELVAQRKATYNLANQKNKIALKAIKKLRYLPGLKMVAVCNNFYYTATSDIDIFIISQQQRLWLTRLLVTGLTHLLGQRRHGRKIANRLCLSFYISEAALDLKSVTLADDPYFYAWLAWLLPLYGSDNYDKFWQANNWLNDKLPNCQSRQVNPSLCLKDNSLLKLGQAFNRLWFASRLGDRLEALAKKIQLAKMATNTASLAKAADSRVVIADTMLKFHENDRRQYFYERHQAILKQLNYEQQI